MPQRARSRWNQIIEWQKSFTNTERRRIVPSSDGSRHTGDVRIPLQGQSVLIHGKTDKWNYHSLATVIIWASFSAPDDHRRRLRDYINQKCYKILQVQLYFWDSSIWKIYRRNKMWLRKMGLTIFSEFWLFKVLQQRYKLPHFQKEMKLELCRHFWKCVHSHTKIKCLLQQTERLRLYTDFSVKSLNFWNILVPTSLLMGYCCWKGSQDVQKILSLRNNTFILSLCATYIFFVT